MRFTAEDHARIAAAIAAAEQHTSGEIFCVVAKRVSSYRDVSLAWAAAGALILPIMLIPLGFEPNWVPGAASGWEAAHLAAVDITVGRALAAYAMIQAAVFALVFALASVPPVRRLLTPAAVRRARVRRVALQQFLSHGLHLTEGRTGVLIFAALDDHQVEVVADEGIYARVSEDVWAETVAALTQRLRANRVVEGFEAAVAICGRVLAEHFPPGPQNANEKPDRLVII